MHDVVVVGAGAAGGWAAKELCERGLDVLLLDAGPALDPARDFPRPAPPERRLRARLAAALDGQPVQMRCAAFNARTGRFFVDDRENPYTTAPGAPFNWFRGRQVGGRLHVWARVTPRLTERELEPWPVSSAELAPAYDRVERFLGVSEAEPTPAEERFKRAVESAFPGRQVLPAPIAERDDAAEPATIRAARRAGGLTLRPDAVVRRISVDDATGRATGVLYVDRRTKRELAAPARAVVLAASTIETVRLLLGSSSRAHPRGLGNSSGQLGLGLMDHVFSGVGGPVGAPGAELNGGAPDPYDFGSVTGFRIPHPDRRWAVQGAIDRQAPGWYFLGHGEMSRREENRVVLDPVKRDAWDVPAARIACAPGPDDLAMATEQLETMRELAAAGGLEPRSPPSGRRLDALAYRAWRSRVVASSGAFLPGSAAHEIGGAAMGSDPETSVVDPFGRCWDAPNVFVADGAAFPAGCWQNVTLTIMALAVRTSAHLAQEYAAARL